MQNNEKLRAACDECRIRKLKCTGEIPICSRCQKESARCVYSPQKQMGRPRKRRREATDEEGTLGHDVSPDRQQPTFSGPLPSMPTTIGEENEFTAFPELDAFSGYADSHTSRIDLCPPVVQDGNNVPSALIEVFTQDLSLNPVISVDPSLWNTTLNAPPSTGSAYSPQSNDTVNIGVSGTPSDALSTAAQSPCACLSSVYLSLSGLQSMTIFAFPAVIRPLRMAMETADSILACEKCPKEIFNAMQNLLGLTSLLSAIAERYHKVLSALDAEAATLEQKGEKKSWRMGDNDPRFIHLHTGTLDCPMGVDIELEPREWHRICKRIVKNEVHGQRGSARPGYQQSLIGLVERMEERQHRWHQELVEERKKIFATCESDGSMMYRDGNCLRIIDQVRTMVRSLDLD